MNGVNTVADQTATHTNFPTPPPPPHKITRPPADGKTWFTYNLQKAKDRQRVVTLLKNTFAKMLNIEPHKRDQLVHGLLFVPTLTVNTLFSMLVRNINQFEITYTFPEWGPYGGEQDLRKQNIFGSGSAINASLKNSTKIDRAQLFWLLPTAFAHAKIVKRLRDAEQILL